MPEPVAERPIREPDVLEQAATLQEAVRRKDEYLATLAHNLRNRLAPISNALEICQRLDADSGQLLELHEIIRRQVSEITRLIDDLCDVSRVVRSNVELGKDQTDERQGDSHDAPAAELPALKILVVDDVRASGRTLALMLGAIGQHAEVLNDGAAAVEWVVGNRPDVAFVDIAMPGMSGYDVAREIRRHKELHGVCLVALTGYAGEEGRRRALESGFDHHLTKPTSLDALRRLIAAIARNPSELGFRELPNSE
jgi:CheY-like chemotaxis protein